MHGPSFVLEWHEKIDDDLPEGWIAYDYDLSLTFFTYAPHLRCSINYLPLGRFSVSVLSTNSDKQVSSYLVPGYTSNISNFKLSG